MPVPAPAVTPVAAMMPAAMVAAAMMPAALVAPVPAAGMHAASAPTLGRRRLDPGAEQQQTHRHDETDPQPSALHRRPPTGCESARICAHYTPGRRNQSSSASRVLRKARASQGMSWRAKKPISLTSWASAAASRPSGTVT